MRNMKRALLGLAVHPTRSRRPGVVAAIAFALVMSFAAAPASGVVNGQPDGTTHPYVGTLALKLSGDPPTYHAWCSGTMVTARIFVAAGHCMSPEFLEASYPGSEILGLTLAPVVETTTEPKHYAGTAVPMLGWPGKNWTRDVGVFILKDEILLLKGMDLPVLPEVGQVSELDLKGQEVTIVGYGWDRARTGGPNGLDPTAAGTRRYATEKVVAVAPRNLHLLSNIAGGASGMCYGDSGAPRLFDHGEETIIVATSWWLGTYCQAPEMPLRLDTREIHDWLELVVETNPTSE